jgi:phytoene dehydrogenase-like protein
MSAKRYDTIIVGAGHNGLVASWYLANAGLRVLVLERRPFVGGACVTEELWPGFQVPSCAYALYLLRDRIIEDMTLRDFGFEVWEGYSPDGFIPYPDGRAIRHWDEEERFLADIAHFSPADAAAVRAFQQDLSDMASLLDHWFLSPPPSLTEFAHHAGAVGKGRALERLLYGTVQGFLNEYFESPEVRGYFLGAWSDDDIDRPGGLFYPAYTLVSRFNAPENRGLVKGGMGGVTQAMARSAEARGVEIRTGAEVSEIVVENGRTVGVRLGDGEQVQASVMLSNADPKRTLLRMIAPGHLSPGFHRVVNGLKTEIAHHKFHARLNRLPDFSRYLGDTYDQRVLGQISVCGSDDHYCTAWREAQAGLIPKRPLLHIQIPTVYDTAMAPEGRHVLSMWVQWAPAEPVAGSWDDLREQTGEDLITHLAEYVPDIRSCIDDWLLFTPLDLERRIGMTDGNIRHVDLAAGQWLSYRPHPSLAQYATPIEGLYLCGAAMHPGGEVSGGPGHNAAQRVLADLGIAAAAR